MTTPQKPVKVLVDREAKPRAPVSDVEAQIDLYKKMRSRFMGVAADLNEEIERLKSK